MFGKNDFFGKTAVFSAVTGRDSAFIAFLDTTEAGQVVRETTWSWVSAFGYGGDEALTWQLLIESGGNMAVAEEKARDLDWIDWS